jgi:hypothetical protein
MDDDEARLKKLRHEAAALGLRLAREELDATLPAVRCTKAERKRAEQLARASGITLSEHIRRRAITSD